MTTNVIIIPLLAHTIIFNIFFFFLHTCKYIVGTRTRLIRISIQRRRGKPHKGPLRAADIGTVSPPEGKKISYQYFGGFSGKVNRIGFSVNASCTRHCVQRKITQLRYNTYSCRRRIIILLSTYAYNTSCSIYNAVMPNPWSLQVFKII